MLRRRRRRADQYDRHTTEYFTLSSESGGCGGGPPPSAINRIRNKIALKKKQKQIIESFEIEVDGEREKIEDYSLFRDICLHFKIKGKVDLDKAERAVKLSIEKYCSVSKTLELILKNFPESSLENFN